MRCITYCFILAGLLGCASKGPDREAFWKRPSRRAFLSPGILGNASLSHIDRDLTRIYWESDYRAVVTPLSVPLISRLAVLECERTSCTATQRKKLVENLSHAFAARRSCFYFFLADAPSNQVNEGERSYKLFYRNEGGPVQQASGPSKKLKATRVYRVQRKLLNRYLPYGSQSRSRNTLGFVGAKAEVICGKPIDFRKPFSFGIQPEHHTKPKTALLRWTKQDSD